MMHISWRCVPDRCVPEQSSWDHASPLYDMSHGLCVPERYAPNPIVDLEQPLHRRVIYGHTATAIPFIYSFSGTSAASATISTFMCLWAISIFPGTVYIFPPAETAAPSWEYIIHSQTHECGNWDWGPDIPFRGIFASNFLHFFFAVQCHWHRRCDETVATISACLHLKANIKGTVQRDGSGRN